MLSHNLLLNHSYIRIVNIVHYIGDGMARSKAPGPVGRPRRKGKWVRKNMVMDPRKLAAAKAYLGVETETEAVDAALDLVAFQAEVLGGLRTLAAAGPWRTVLAD